MRGKLTILHIEDRVNPDYGYQINNLANLHDRNFDFKIISSTSFYPWKNADPEFIKNNRDREFEKRCEITIDRLPLLFEIESRVWMKGLVKKIREINPDIIFAHGLETFTAIRIISSSLSNRILIVSDTHTLLNLSKNAFLAGIFYFLFKKIFIPLLNSKNIVVFYTAEENKLILENRYGVNPRNIRSGLIGTNTSLFSFSYKQRNDLRKKYNIDDDMVVILFTGKIDHHKRPHYILEALKTLEGSDIPELHLILIGEVENAYFSEYSDIQFSNPRIRVTLLPRIENSLLPAYYSMADMAVFPTYNTLSCLDAQACRLPVIVEDNATNRQRVIEGGLLFRKDDIADLAAKIQIMISDKDLCKILGRAGEQFIREKYDYSRIIKQMEDDILKAYHQKKLN